MGRGDNENRRGAEEQPYVSDVSQIHLLATDEERGLRQDLNGRIIGPMIGIAAPVGRGRTPGREPGEDIMRHPRERGKQLRPEERRVGGHAT